jgi:hypothetical protein
MYGPEGLVGTAEVETRQKRVSSFVWNRHVMLMIVPGTIDWLWS